MDNWEKYPFTHPPLDLYPSFIKLFFLPIFYDRITLLSLSSKTMGRKLFLSLSFKPTEGSTGRKHGKEARERKPFLTTISARDDIHKSRLLVCKVILTEESTSAF